MIVVELSTEQQTVSVLPRFYDEISTGTVNITLTNEDTREDVNLGQGNITLSDGFLNFGVTTSSGHDTQNCTFKVKITDSITSQDPVNDTVIFRGLMFVTNQTPQDYSIYG